MNAYFCAWRQVRLDIRCLDSTRPRNASGIGCPRRRDDRIEMLFAAVHESLAGTNRASSDVRSPVAIGWKADVGGTPHFGSD